jgi:uncharacterized repeat protein (TIGR01451 family)
MRTQALRPLGPGRVSGVRRLAPSSKFRVHPDGPAGRAGLNRLLLVSALAGVTAASAAVPRPEAAAQSGGGAGLVAAYGFEESTGTTITDASGNGNTGALGSATRTSSGKFGAALSFNGTNAKVVIPDAPSLRLTTGMTLEAWVNPSTISNTWRDIVYKGNDNYYLMAMSQNGRRPVGGGIVGVTTEAIGASALTAGTWTHLAATFDGTAMRLFVNGVQAGSASRSGTLAVSGNPLELGGDSIFGQYFSGVIDEVRVYNVALSQAQIQADMNTPVVAPSPTPDLSLIKSHAGNFSQGQSGAAYTLTISNVGTAGTSGTVTVTDTVPAGLTATGLSGSGWNCTLATATCTRADALPGGSAYPAITVTVNVSLSAPASVTNVASVSGGGDTNSANNSSSDPTTILTAPDSEPPSAPGVLSGTAVSGTRVNLTWGAATDNIGVTAYRVERCQGAGCSTFAQVGTSATTTFADTGVTANSSYSYQVRAADAAGNVGPPSNVVTVSTPATSPQLVAAFGFEEPSGATVTDSSGTGNNGALGTVTRTSAGKYGAALRFNGSSRVTVPDAASLRLTGAMTLEAWVKPTSSPNSWVDVVYKGNDNYYLMASSTNASRPVAGGIVNGTHSEAVGTSSLPANTWTHLAATFDGTTMRLFVNGVQASTAARTGTLATSANPLEIGGDGIFGQYFIGDIDEVRVYNVALTQAQIQTDMNTPVVAASPTPDLSLVKSHSGGFSQGQIGAAYTLTVSNVGTAATSGTVTVTDTLPAGLTATALSGSGWSCAVATATCTRADALAAGSAYPAITLTVDVSVSAPSAVTNVAAVSGGGDTNSANNSSSDPTAILTAPDSEPPSAPGVLSATAVSGTQVNLTWGPATDNVGVTGYRVERCQGAGCSTFVKLATPAGTSFSDTGLSPNTSYSYFVRATDAAGNLGPESNTATAVTLGTVPELVAAYGFEEPTGTTVADSSIYGNNGSLGSATRTTSGKYGAALSFNGSNARVTVPDAASLRLAGAMTLEAWVNPSAIANRWQDVVYKGNDNYYLMATSTNSSRPVGGGIVSGTTTEAIAPTTLAVNTWSHLAVTFDGSTIRLYVNGTQVSSATRTGTLASSNNPLQIGGDGIFGQYFSGRIDEVRVYNVARTPSQIQADMNTPVAALVPAVTIAPASLDFGPQETGSASAPQSVVLTNSGLAAVSISSIAVTAGGTDYSVTSTCGSTLAAGASCAISVTFRPAAVGTRTGVLTVTTNASGSPHQVGLTGQGVGFAITPPVATLTPGQTQQFGVPGGFTGLTWSVDGLAGGSAAAGTIGSDGVYQAPAAAGVHTVSVTDGTRTSSATVYVSAHPGIFTHHIDTARTGQNLSETVLTLSNVNTASFGKLYSYPIDGIAHASPLYVRGVNIPGVGVRNVVYVATEHDSVYAFDADGGSATPLWHVSFINPSAGITTVPASDTNECCDIAPEIGITSTPVIDPSTSTIYLVAKTKEVSGSTTAYRHRLHALDLATGAEKFGGPVILQASVSGRGVGSSGNTLTFNSLRENQRPALLLVNGVIYIGFGSHGDNQPYHGWLLGYSASSLQRVMTYCATPDGEGAGIWQANGGPAADAAGNIYFITADGTFSANTGGRDYGTSFVKISPSGTVLDYFTPADQADLNLSNFDLGAAGPLLLPDQPGSHPHLMISAGKNNTAYLVDRDNMGHFNPNDDSHAVQSLPNIFPFGTPEPGNYSAPVYFNGAVYFSPIADAIQKFTLTNGLLSTSATSRSAAVFAYPGAALTVSADGSTNGILWAVERRGGVVGENDISSPGTLHAYDAGNLSHELWNSDQAGARDQMGPTAKFSIPAVVNGKVFVATATDLTVYGLIR